MRLRLLPVFAALLTAGLSLSAAADDIADQITEAQKAYEKHDLTATLAALDTAGRLLRQAKSDSWQTLLPAAPAGWSAADAEVTTVALESFGGGTSVSRAYQKGDATVTVAYVAESPVIQAVGSVMANGQTIAEDAKLLIIDGRKVTYSKSDTSYTTMVGKVLVSVKGDGADDAALRAFLKAIDYAGLEKAGSGS